MMDEAVRGARARDRAGPRRRRARPCSARTRSAAPALPEEVAEAALLLRANGAITGQAIHVDGGEVMA